MQTRRLETRTAAREAAALLIDRTQAMLKLRNNSPPCQTSQGPERKFMFQPFSTAVLRVSLEPLQST